MILLEIGLLCRSNFPNTGMKSLVQKAEIRKSKIHRWGVFAKNDIRKGGIIEQCPFLLTFGENHKKMQDYLFHYSPTTGMIILGYGSLYNHSPENNAEYFEDTTHKLIEIVATRKIKKGEEIFINYGEEYFTNRGMKIK